MNLKLEIGKLAGCLGLVALLGAGAAQAKPIALLVGVSNYPGRNALEGPANDVVSMREVLTQNWGFADTDIKTLINSEATHANILRELAALKSRSAPGDVVFVYFSGHGTSALDTHLNLPMPHTTGAFVPIDAPDGNTLTKLAHQDRLADGLIIGRTHLRPLFAELDKDRKVFMVSDSCYSGNLSRSVQLQNQHAKYRYMAIKMDAESMTGKQSVKFDEAPEPYPYQQMVFLSAASESEQARDLGFSDMVLNETRDKKPHGAMTDALLRVLWGEVSADANGDGKLSYSEIYRATLQFMETRQYGHTPQRLPGVVEDSRNSITALAFGNGLPKSGLHNAGSGAIVRVRLSSVLGDVKATLQNLLSVKLVGATDSADLELSAVKTGVELRTGSGDPVLSRPNFDDVMLSRIEADAWWRGLVVGAQAGFGVQVATSPEHKGNTFTEGNEFKFIVKSESTATLIILNISSEGKVSVLYPREKSARKKVEANQVMSLPEGTSNIVVTPPFGMDQVLVLALPEPPVDWHGVNAPLDNMSIQSPAMQGLKQLISEQHGRFAWQALSVRTYPAPAKQEKH